MYRILGKIVTIHSITKIIPDIFFRTCSCTPVHSTLTFNNKVNAIIDRANDNTITRIFFLLSWTNQEPIITGNTGKTQGASMVNTPDINAAI